MLTVGIDVGGANTKVVVCAQTQPLDSSKKQVLSIERVESRYFPFWQDYPRFPEFLRGMLGPYLRQPHQLLVTTTAELADCFQTKREGVRFVLSAVTGVDPSAGVLLNSGEVVDMDHALTRPLMVAAANWVAPALLIASIFPDSIFIDVGSTTTDIIPIAGGRHQVQDPSDKGRLSNDQLVYTGALRTNVATVVDHVVLHGTSIGLASENFAASGDINLLLGLIDPEDFTVPTADGGPATREGALRRLSRVICSDTEETPEPDIIRMAEYIHAVQVSKISWHIERLLHRHGFHSSIPCVLAGIGIRALAEPAARVAGLTKLQAFHQLVREALGVRLKATPQAVSTNAPAASLAVLGARGDLGCG